MRRKFDATMRQYEVKTAVAKVGKNRFNKDDASLIYSCYIQEGGVITASSSYRSIRIPIEPNTTYTASIGLSLSYFRVAFADTDADPATGNITATAYVRQTNTNPITMTSGDNDVVMYVNFPCTDATLAERLAAIQIEEGSEATEYEPYTETRPNQWDDGMKSGFPSVKLFGATSQAAEPTPDAPQDVVANNALVKSTNAVGTYDGGEATAPTLYAIGDYRDEWNPQTGKGLRRIGKADIASEEYWTATSSRVFSSTDVMPNAVQNPVYVDKMPMLCSHYPVIAHSKATSNSEFGVAFWKSGTSKALSFSFGDGPVYTAEEWKAWMAAQKEAGTPLTIWYALAEPIPFETEPMPLSCPTGYGQIVQVAGDIPDCPLEVKYLSHGGNKA